jgi:hypothetical protein
MAGMRVWYFAISGLSILAWTWGTTTSIFAEVGVGFFNPTRGIQRQVAKSRRRKEQPEKFKTAETEIYHGGQD